jgi:two-component system response regulator CpxR
MTKPPEKEKVLLVDDEKEFVETLSERLCTRGFNTSTALSGEEALSVFNDVPAEAVVLDLKMPGMDGLEVLRRIKSRHPDVEIIMLTGHGSDKERQTAMDLGAFAYFTKPQDIDVLAAAIRQALESAGRPLAKEPVE